MYWCRRSCRRYRPPRSSAWPTARLLVLKVATPVLRVPVPSVVVPSMKVTVPVGVLPVPDEGATVAVNCTGSTGRTDGVGAGGERRRARLDRQRRRVNEGGVVSTGTVQSLECDRMSPGSGDGERDSGVALVGRTRWCEGAHDAAVDQHVKVFGSPVVAALGGVEGEHVGPGCQAGDTLAERAGLLEEGDLGPLGCVGIARGEAAVVAGDARAAGEDPR